MKRDRIAAVSFAGEYFIVTLYFYTALGKKCVRAIHATCSTLTLLTTADRNNLWLTVYCHYYLTTGAACFS